MACLKRVANDGFILNIASLYTHPHISIPPIALTNSQHSLQRGHTLDTVVGNTANRTTCTLTVSPICTSIQYCMTYRGLGFVAPSWRFPSIVLYISAHAVVAERELNHTVRVEYLVIALNTTMWENIYPSPTVPECYGKRCEVVVNHSQLWLAARVNMHLVMKTTHSFSLWAMDTM